MKSLYASESRTKASLSLKTTETEMGGPIPGAPITMPENESIRVMAMQAAIFIVTFDFRLSNYLTSMSIYTAHGLDDVPAWGRTLDIMTPSVFGVKKFSASVPYHITSGFM